MGQWLLRITPQESASPDDFKTAVQPLNDFLLQVEAIKESDIPKLTYPGSARLTCNVIWYLAGCLHCKRALSARIADGPKAAHPSASEWADYFHKLGNALVEVSADEEHFKDRERCGILNKGQHQNLQSEFTSFFPPMICTQIPAWKRTWRPIATDTFKTIWKWACRISVTRSRLLCTTILRRPRSTLQEQNRPTKKNLTAGRQIML